jgi:CheY-like chemotaxis protein
MAKEILIADSDKTDQEEFQKIFEATDYHLIFSENGEETLLRIKLFKPDMIIASGAGLQEMGGLELCGFLKEDPEFKQIPFILISSIFDEISEKDQQRVQADGMISKPLDEDEILNLVDHLMEDKVIGKREKMVPKEKGEFSLDEMGEEEEIIELVDVVEEPESRMSINDFFTTGKEPVSEITHLESWEKLELEEKPKEKEFMPPPERKKEIIPPQAKLEEELFKKIELEEILQKVEHLKPSLEKEWPTEKEEKVFEEVPLEREEPDEKYFDLSEFEAALQNEVKTEMEEVELAPLPFEISKENVSEKTIPIKESVEEEEIEELAEEEFPEELFEEILGEEEIGLIEEPKEVRSEEVSIKEIPPEKIKIEPATIRIEPEAPRMEPFEGFEAPKIFGEEIIPLVSQPTGELEEVSPLTKIVDKHLEEVIAKGIQDMIGDFITKILPEMTQHIIGLTADRIEKMVREIVPDLAEKAIQEEINRLQKGEKN